MAQDDAEQFGAQAGISQRDDLTRGAGQPICGPFIKRERFLVVVSAVIADAVTILINGFLVEVA